MKHELAVFAIAEVGAVLVKVQHIQKADTIGHLFKQMVFLSPS